MKVQSYESAAEYLGGKSDRPAEHGTATRIVRRGPDVIAVRYHETDVVTYHADGRLVLDSGGWMTATTKVRLNDYAVGFGVWSTGGVWHVSARNLDYTLDGGAPYWSPGSVVFYDGLTVDQSDPAGSLTVAGTTPEAVAGLVTVRADEATKRAVSRYCAKVRRTWPDVIGQARESGTAGDCWICNGTVPGRGDIDHLREHVADGYVVASLGLAAVKAAGYFQPGAVVGHTDIVVRATRRYLLARLLVGPSSGRRALPGPRAMAGYVA